MKRVRVGRWAAAALLFLGSVSWAQDSSGRTGVTLETDRSFYLVGEEVRLTLTNSSRRAKTIGVSSWGIKKGRKTFYQPPVARGLFQLAPGASYSKSWNMKNGQGETAAPGLYRAYYKVGEATLTASFEILKRPETEAEVLVKTVKRNFELGEAVRFYVVNRSEMNVDLGGMAPWKIRGERSHGKHPVVFEPHIVTIRAVDPLKPGQRVMWSWDQKNDKGEPVKAGKYHVLLSLGLPEGVKEFRRDFEIKE